MTTHRIIIGLSGGVDSAVAAHLLQKQGHHVEALFMKNWEEDDQSGYCAASEDLADAQRICEQLDIPLHTVNFSSEYWDQVFEYFLEEHRRGRTPNPDVLCNTKIKFHHFCDHALKLGAEKIATGHYAQVRQIDHQYGLFACADNSKDQTYFLHGLNQQQLSHSLFPLGSYQKSQIRDLARQLDLHVYNKKDSTGICFIGERRFQEFLQRYLPACEGDIIDTNGRTVGRHQGVSFYTIGQRQGLGIGGTAHGTEEPWYVVDKNMEDNVLIVAQGSSHASLFHNTLLTGPVHWIREPYIGFGISAKIRYRQAQQNCVLQALDENRCRVIFEQPQRAITPGQFIVFYHDDECLGGATIEQREHVD